MAKKAAAAKANAAKEDASKADTTKKITNVEAVRQIMKMYPKAKPKELSPLLFEKFGVKLNPQRISMAGVYLRKQAGKPSKRGSGKKMISSTGNKFRKGEELSLSELVAAQQAINNLGGEKGIQNILSQISAAKKLLANA